MTTTPPVHVSHLRRDTDPGTVCGDPRQTWQTPNDYTGPTVLTTAPTHTGDLIRCCAPCIHATLTSMTASPGHRLDRVEVDPRAL